MESLPKEKKKKTTVMNAFAISFWSEVDDFPSFAVE